MRMRPECIHWETGFIDEIGRHWPVAFFHTEEEAYIERRAVKATLQALGKWDCSVYSRQHEPQTFSDGVTYRHAECLPHTAEEIVISVRSKRSAQRRTADKEEQAS